MPIAIGDSVVQGIARVDPYVNVSPRAARDGRSDKPGTIQYVGTRLADSGTPWAVIDVSDTGPGIPAEHQQRIFAESERLGNVGIAGAGIGLAISQRTADLLGGRISVASEVGGGSTFTLWLPLPLEAR